MPALHHRGAGVPGDPAVLLVHGYPESSHMWREVLPALAAAGLHAIAPDLAGFGDSEADPPGTWERHVDALKRFRAAQGLDRRVGRERPVRAACRGAALRVGAARAELEVIDGAGHFVVDDAPERYAGSLVSVLSRARPGTAR